MAGAVCLTFDDCTLDSWVDAAPLLTLSRARATFFISYFPHAVDGAGLSKLDFLAAAGHELGCHSVNHFHPQRFLSVFTVDEYLRTEVLPAVRTMRGCGISCTSWCYPFNASTPELQARLAELFIIQRGRAETPEQALAAPGDRLIFGRSIDTYVAGQPDRVNDVAPILALLEQAADADRIAVLYGHDIAPAATIAHAVAPQALMAIINKARDLGMSFVTASEIANG